MSEEQFKLLITLAMLETIQLEHDIGAKTLLAVMGDRLYAMRIDCKPWETVGVERALVGFIEGVRKEIEEKWK